MGREIRRVPLDWQHPRDRRGSYVPLFDETYEHALAEREVGEPRPDRARYRPPWPADAGLGYQVYENVSEGTPMSPVFATEDELVAWLTDEQPIGIGGRPLRLTEAQARAFIEAGGAPSFAFTNATGFVSGLQLRPRAD